jgi:hypothetical protein
MLVLYKDEYDSFTAVRRLECVAIQTIYSVSKLTWLLAAESKPMVESWTFSCQATSAMY